MPNSPIKNSTLNRTNLVRLNKVFDNAGIKGKTIIATETPGGVQPNDTLFLNIKNGFHIINKGTDYFENFALKYIPNYQTIRKLDDDIIKKMYTTDNDYNTNTSVHITTTKNMFKDCANLEEVPRFPYIYDTGSNGVQYVHGSDGIISAESMFEGCTSLKYVDFTNRWLNTPSGTREYLFSYNTTFKNMFKGCTNLKHIFGWISLGDALNRFSMGKVIPPNYEEFKAYINRTFDSMFEGCTSLKKVDIIFLSNNTTPATSSDENITDIFETCILDHTLTLEELKSLIKTASKAPDSLEIVLY